jgi:hypothetical protein
MKEMTRVQARASEHASEGTEHAKVRDFSLFPTVNDNGSALLADPSPLEQGRGLRSR